jgi:hypothetical protein
VNRHTLFIGENWIFFIELLRIPANRRENPRTRPPASSPAAPGFLHFPIEFSIILAYAKDADEIVRQVCRDRTGWRRDEWAYSPLFICGKFPDFWGHFPRFWLETGQTLPGLFR